MNEKFLSASYKGKDLLESTGANPKASLEFKSLMEEISENYFAKEKDKFIGKIYDFAFFIYGDKTRANFFTDKIVDELN